MKTIENAFFELHKLVLKYNSWYFFKKFVSFNKTRLTATIVLATLWIILAANAIITGNQAIAGGLFLFILALRVIYPVLLRKNYPKKERDLMWLYNEQDFGLQILTITRILKEQGKFTPSFIKEALNSGENQDKSLSILYKINTIPYFHTLIYLMILFAIINTQLHFINSQCISILMILLSVGVFIDRFFIINYFYSSKYRQFKTTLFIAKMLGFDEEINEKLNGKKTEDI